MNEMKRLLSFVRRAVDDYEMIDDGDRIAVGISGGKDSLTLLAALAEMRRFYPKKYDIVAITVDMGFEGEGIAKIDGYTVFIKGALKGEKVKIKILKFL